MTTVTIPQAFEIALSHHQAGRLTEAEAIYRQILAQQPNHADALHLLGVLAGQTGHAEAGIELIRQSIALAPAVPDYHSNLGNLLLETGCFQEASDASRRALALRPDYPEAHSNLGHALRGLGRLDDAIAAYRRAIALKPDFAEAHYNLSNALKGLGLLDESIAAYRQAIALRPHYPEAYNNLGNALKGRGQLAEASDAYRQALVLKPDYPEAHSNLGNALKGLGQFDEAVTSYRRAIGLKSDFAEAHYNLGNALNDQAKLDDAVASYRQAIALRPDYAEAHSNLGNALLEQGHFTEAVASNRRAIALKPDFAEAYYTLGNVLKAQGLLDESIAAYHRAIALRPDYPETYTNLGNVFKDQAKLDDALAAYRQTIALRPDYAEVHSNLIYSLQFHPDYDAQAIAEAQREWNQQLALSLAPLVRTHPNDRSPDRRLRIGYVSPDLCEHVVGHNLLPLIRQHDPRQVEIFCYSQVTAGDVMTKQFRRHAHAWRDIVGLTDEQAAELIREDGIDILVDLTLHMAKNRLRVFARKPAPVQVSFAGYPGSTGLDAIPYHLTDPFLEPPGQQDDFSADEAVRLPDSFWCYAATAVHLPVGPLPSEANGYITFGCLNNLCKVNPGVLRLWAKVLREVAGSRLLLLARQGSGREWIQAALREEGIESDRVEFADHQSRWKYLETYRRIDVGLDTLPYNGHTTSLDSLWMGVPVVTLVGTTVVGRAGLSQLSNLGLPELVAWTADEYVEIAAGLAGDRSRLASLRSSLRARMQSSPLMDAPKFAHGVEAAYRYMWHRWCQGSGAE